MIDYANRIWKTRKVRINTEARLNFNAHIIDLLIPLYSLNFILITILPLNKNETWVTFISIAGSLGILIGSIIASNQKFRIRAYEMRMHYIKLDKLYTKISNCQDDEKSKIFEEYSKELESIENHTDFDYKKTQISLRNDPQSKFIKPTNIEVVNYFLVVFCKKIFIVILLVIPFLIDLLIVL